MTSWGLAAGLFGLVLVFAGSTRPIRHRHIAFAAALAYTLVAFGVGTLVTSLWANLLAPGGLLLAGYWLSGLFFDRPQPWLERWLLATDYRIRAERWMDSLPRPLAELLEACYAADYLVIGGGAIYAATFGTDAVAYYWSLVLTAELASFAPLPWLRSRPPRAIECGGDAALDAVLVEANATVYGRPGQASFGGGPGPGGLPRAPRKRRGLYLRKLNTAILDNASVQANTLPSGHVSGAVAAALGVLAVDATAGWALMVTAVLIAIAAIAGRYHYMVDCAAGAAVAAAVWSVM